MLFSWMFWVPEIYFIVTLLGILLYGIHRGNAMPAEYSVYKRRDFKTGGSSLLLGKGPSRGATLARESLPDGKGPLLLGESPNSSSTLRSCLTGPTWLQQNLAIWSVVWCFMGCFLLLEFPFHLVYPSGLFLRDALNTNFSLVLLIFAGLFILLSKEWMYSAKIVHVEYTSLILLALLGQHLLLMCTDLLSLYVCLERQSFCFVVLCSFNYHSLYSVEAGMKYFLLSAFSSCLLLLGISFIYWATGFTNCAHLQEFLVLNMSTMSSHSSYLIVCLLGIWLVSLTLLWKLAAAPMHMWAADVYMGAWSSVTLRISTLPKLAVLGFWFHFWHVIWQQSFTNTMMFFSALSMIVGAFGAIGQVHMKRLLAYSSIGHMGFLLMPLSLPYSGASVSALFTHLIIYFWTSLAVWGRFMWPFYRRGTINTGTPQYLWDFSVLWKTQPFCAWTMTIAVMSLAGLPPVAGFLGKLGIFWWSLNAHQYLLLAIALFSTFISSIYYLRVIRIMYIDEPKKWSVFQQMPNTNAYRVSISMVGLLLLLWYSSPLVLTTHLYGLYC